MAILYRTCSVHTICFSVAVFVFRHEVKLLCYCLLIKSHLADLEEVVRLLVGAIGLLLWGVL